LAEGGGGDERKGGVGREVNPMGAHVIIHWRPDASLKARETILRLASEMKWRLAESSVTVVSFGQGAKAALGDRRGGEVLQPSELAGR